MQRSHLRLDTCLLCQSFRVQTFVKLLELRNLRRVAVHVLVVARGQVAEEPFHRPAARKVFLEDGVGVGRLHTAIPHRLGVDHHVRAVAALVQAAGAVDAHQGTKSCFGDALLQPLEQAFRVAIEGAIGAVGADEYVFLVVCQRWTPLGDVLLRVSWQVVMARRTILRNAALVNDSGSA